MWFRRHPVQQVARLARKYPSLSSQYLPQELLESDQLTILGFRTAANLLTMRAANAHKILTARQRYPMIAHEQWVNATKKLAFKGYGLRVVTLADYPNVPPLSVLRALETAISYKCFDNLAIYRVEKLPKDPMLVGTITNYGGRFVIAVWGEDIDMELFS